MGAEVQQDRAASSGERMGPACWRERPRDRELCYTNVRPRAGHTQSISAGDINGPTREGEETGSERVNRAHPQEGRNVTVPDLMCGSNASSAGISGRVSANRFRRSS
jgi:hypothetical protein